MSITLDAPRTSAVKPNRGRAAPARPSNAAPAPLPPPPSLRDMPRDRNVHIPMSREQWWEYPFEGKSEWADGEAILMPPAAPAHSIIQSRLARIVGSEVPGVEAPTEFGVDIGRSYRVPDLAITKAARLRDGVVPRRPIVVVEVISPASRRTDRVRKPAEYLAEGVGQYWIVDPSRETVEVMVSDRGKQWLPLATIDADNPIAEIDIAGHGVVTLRHEEIFQ